jgi:hypothetical protein
VAAQQLGLVDRGLHGGDRVAVPWVVVTGQARQSLAQSSTNPPMRQIPPARLSSWLKSVCHTRLRRVGGSRNTARRAAASWRRSAW